MALLGCLMSVSLVGGSAAPPLDTVRARLTAVIGESAPRTPFLLGEISGLALDDSGRVYVADFQDPRVVVFAPDGRHLATIGRKGRGPGEFTAPTGPVIGPDHALYVRNMEQILRFVRDPATGLATQFDRGLSGPMMAPWRSKLPSIIDRALRFYFPLEVGLPDGLTHYSYRRYTLEGRKLDSVAVPIYPTARSSWAFYSTGGGNGRMVAGLNVVPFHPLPVWTISPAGSLISGPADKYELLETDSAGRIVRTIARSVRPDAIPVAERADSLRALKRRVDSIPVPLSALKGASDEVRSLRLPEVYPFYQSVTAVAETGEIWVRRWQRPSLRGMTLLDVFAPNGSYGRTVVLPMNCAPAPALVIRGTTAACVQVDPESGAEAVVVARFDRSP